jgi:peroxiredoxin
MSWQGSEQSMQKFVDKHGLTFRNVNDDSGILFGRFGVPSQPAWAFIGKDASVCVGLGVVENAELDRVFGELEAGTFMC